MSFSSCAYVATKTAETLASANLYTDSKTSQAAIVAALALKNCAGTLHAAGASVPSCAEMTAAIDAAIAALPGDKFLQGLQSYNPATNVMTLLMSDGSTVTVDMTALVNDAVASIAVATDTVQGKVALNLGTNLPADATNTTDALTAAGVTTILNSPTANPLKTAVLAQVPLATTTVAGLIEEATGEETRLGATDANKDDRAVTPGSMSYTLQGGRSYPIYTSKALSGGAIPNAAGDFFAVTGGIGGAVGFRIQSISPTVTAGAYSAMVAISSGINISAGATLTGAGANVAGTNNGLVSGVSGVITAAGTGENRALYGTAEGAGGTNIGVYGRAINGTANWAGYFDGNVFYSGSLTSSDERLKDSFAAAPDLSAVKIESFDKYSVSKDEDGKEVRTKIGRFTGVRAQAVQSVAPEMVSEAGDYLAVQESSILFAMIDGLRKELAALKAAK